MPMKKKKSACAAPCPASVPILRRNVDVYPARRRADRRFGPAGVVRSEGRGPRPPGPVLASPRLLSCRSLYCAWRYSARQLDAPCSSTCTPPPEAKPTALSSSSVSEPDEVNAVVSSAVVPTLAVGGRSRVSAKPARAPEVVLAVGPQPSRGRRAKVAGATRCELAAASTARLDADEGAAEAEVVAGVDGQVERLKVGAGRCRSVSGGPRRRMPLVRRPTRRVETAGCVALRQRGRGGQQGRRQARRGSRNPFPSDNSFRVQIRCTRTGIRRSSLPRG
jgi:hypothetical protein